MDKPAIQRIDDALAQYYKDCDRNDYFDESGIGKFRQYADEYQVDEIDVNEALGDDADEDGACVMSVIFPRFPLLISINDRKSRDKITFQILRHCYKYGGAPLLHWQRRWENNENMPSPSASPPPTARFPSPPRTPPPAITIQRIDDVLAQYYNDCGRNDYFDESGLGKFRQFAKENEMEECHVDETLGNEADEFDEDAVSVISAIFPRFPFLISISSNESQDQIIFQIVQHCYKYGVPPSLQWQCMLEKTVKPPIQRVDDALADYYKECGRNDYFN
eukprot:745964_1